MTPLQGKDTKDLKLSAVRNEQVSAQLAIASGHNLDDVKAVVGDLTGPGGTKLSGADTQVRFVKYVPVQRSKSAVAAHGHRRAGGRLVDLDGEQHQHVAVGLAADVDRVVARYRQRRAAVAHLHPPRAFLHRRVGRGDLARGRRSRRPGTVVMRFSSARSMLPRTSDQLDAGTPLAK